MENSISYKDCKMMFTKLKENDNFKSKAIKSFIKSQREEIFKCCCICYRNIEKEKMKKVIFNLFIYLMNIFTDN